VVPVNQHERDEVEDAAEDAARSGRIFAVNLRQFADDHLVDNATLSYALAIVLASLIVDRDSDTGSRKDSQRLSVFVEHVRAAVKEMRTGDEVI
jgi:hypothetical protein